MANLSKPETDINQMNPSPSDSTTSTDNQPQPKTANPNATQLETDANQILSTSDSRTSKDSGALPIDESIPSGKANTEDGSNIENEANVTKQIQFDVSGSEPRNAKSSQMKVDPNGEENTEYNQIHSYSLQLPTIKQLMSQKSLPQETSTKPTKDEKIETSGKFTMVVMRSPNGTKKKIENDRKRNTT